MTKHRWLVVILSMLLTACSFPPPVSLRSPTVIFRGQTLPAPPELGVRRAPPAAWLLVAGTAVPGSFGSYTIRDGGLGGAATYADAPVAEWMPAPLATVRLADDGPAEIVLGSSPLPQPQTIQAIAVTARPWQAAFDFAAPLQQWLLATRSMTGDDVTVFSLLSFGAIQNQVVQAEVTFAEGSQASYVWRINPDQ